jgi:hypothetical protein
MRTDLVSFVALCAIPPVLCKSVSPPLGEDELIHAAGDIPHIPWFSPAESRKQGLVFRGLKKNL